LLKEDALKRTALAAFYGLVVWALAFQASYVAAQTKHCETLPAPRVYLQVGDTQETLMKQMGRALRNSKRMTLIYLTGGSCTNIEAMFAGTKITANMSYIPSSAEDNDWKTSDAALPCVPPTGGHVIDVGNSATFVSSCKPGMTPPTVKIVRGPVQAYLFIVPSASSQTAITAEEGYFTFGFGAQGGVTPWINESLMFIRTQTKSTILTPAAAIGVPASKWFGVRRDKSSEVLKDVSSSVAYEETIGIMGSQVYDAYRANPGGSGQSAIKALAFQGYGQKYAYYADSSPTSYDKQNVRDGHYVSWSPTEWMVSVDSTGKAVNAEAQYFVDMILGKELASSPGFDPLDIVIAEGQGAIPECAMKVTRQAEGSDLSFYTPEQPCGCYFESVAATPSASCIACDANNPCASGVCRRGFCEVQ